jgi:hypothetical protein
MAGGQSSTSGQGSFGRAVTVALAGIALTAALGSVVGASGGQQTTSEQGSVTKTVSVLPTGQAVTLAAGTVTPQQGQIGLTGQAITSSAGTVFPSGNDVTVHVSGVEAEFSSGAFGTGCSLTGQAITTGTGTTAQGVSMPLVGSGMTAEQGLVSSGIDVGEDTYITSSHGNFGNTFDVALTGGEITGAQGALVLSDGQEALSGSESASSAGTATPVSEIALTGQAITTDHGLLGAPGFASLTGSQVSVDAGNVYTDNDRSYALTGQAITASTGDTFASPVCFYGGQTIAVEQEGIGPRTVELSGQQIAVTAGLVTAPVVEVVGGGGWSHFFNPRKRSKNEIDDERVRLGILPAPVQKAIVGAAKKVVSDAKADRALESEVLAGDGVVEPYVRAAVKRTGRKYRDEYTTVAADLARSVLEQEASELAEIWELWNSM